MAQLLGQVAVGTIVKLNEDGSPINYIVVHQGRPSSLYDVSCNGTWLLREDIMENCQWSSTNINTLPGSTIMTTMAGYLAKYEDYIQSAIKTVKIPYCLGNGSPYVNSGENGLECKLFPLGGYEIGLGGVNRALPIDGAKLDYFEAGIETEANNKRISKLSGTATIWWTRSAVNNNTNGKLYIMSDGSYGTTTVNPSYGARPAMIMDPTILVSDDGTVGIPAAPASLNVPIQTMQGKQITVSWTAVDGVSSYILERKANTAADWIQVYSGANTSFEETVGTWTSVQYRVKSFANGKYGDYTTSASVAVVPVSILVISGSDGSLGTLTNDVQYAVSSSGTSALTVTETINGVTTRTYTATNGATNKISVMDLPTGNGTIKITASTNPGSGVVSVTRNWTYTKAAITFPDAGSVADLTQQGKTIWAKTIAEAVRTPGIWGGNLGLALSKLAQAMLYDPSDGTFTDISGGAVPMPQIEVGSYVGTGTHGSANRTTLTFGGFPQFVFVYLAGNQAALMTRDVTQAFELYDNGDWQSRDFINGLKFSSNSVSWYSNTDENTQLNGKGRKYSYIAYLFGGDSK